MSVSTGLQYQKFLYQNFKSIFLLFKPSFNYNGSKKGPYYQNYLSFNTYNVLRHLKICMYTLLLYCYNQKVTHGAKHLAT